MTPVRETADTTGADAGEGADLSVGEALAASGTTGPQFMRGEALSSVEAGDVAASRRATVVVLAGGPNAGKTTLLASLYERFGRGPVAGHLFLGSKTLHGFERRCFRSIYGDGPGGGSGGHTSLTAPPWLHLRTVREDRLHRPFELLLGDFSGEHFEAIASGARKPSEFRWLRRADHLCITLDGDRLSDSASAFAERDLLVALLKELLAEPHSIAGPAAISFVLTKADLVAQRGSAAKKTVEDVFGDLQELLSPHPDARAVAYIQTAARSTHRMLKLGHGMDDLLTRWTDRPALHISSPVRERQPPTSAFDRFSA